MTHISPINAGIEWQIIERKNISIKTEREAPQNGYLITKQSLQSMHLRQNSGRTKEICSSVLYLSD